MGLFEICCLKDLKLEDILLVNRPKYFQKLYVFLQIRPYKQAKILENQNFLQIYF